MELLFVSVIGACIGVIARYALPKRATYGLLLIPAIAAAATAIVWVSLLWIGLTFDGTWIWVAALTAAVVSSVVAALLVPRRREVADTALYAQLAGLKTA